MDKTRGMVATCVPCLFMTYPFLVRNIYFLSKSLPSMGFLPVIAAGTVTTKNTTIRPMVIETIIVNIEYLLVAAQPALRSGFMQPENTYQGWVVHFRNYPPLSIGSESEAGAIF